MHRSATKPRPWSTLAFACATLIAATSAGAQTAARFRLSDLDLRDPHVFVNFLGCRDITDTPLVGFSINGELQTSIQTDGNGNGTLDLSYLLEFVPLRLPPTNFLATGYADCTAPLASTTCGPFTSELQTRTATLDLQAACLQPLAGTIRPYSPAITSTGAPCFASAEGVLVLNLAGLPITLRNVQVGATFVGTPAGSLVNGMLRGFLTEADANATAVPASYPLIGGQPLASLLAGGTGNCASHNDKDVHSGTQGWWFYLNFPAARLADTADVAVSNDDGVASVTAGAPVTYTIVVSNVSAVAVSGVEVDDAFPAELQGCAWTCAPADASTCSASGTGNIADTVSLIANGSVTYSATCTVAPDASGALANTASVTSSGDPVVANNTATDNDTVVRSADLSITKSDGTDTITPGATTTYTIVATNAGPSTATATVGDTPPGALTCAWTCVASAGATCTASGNGVIGDVVTLAPAASVAYQMACNVDGAASGTVANTATISGSNAPDPDTADTTSIDSDDVARPDDLFGDGFEGL